eukprot:TRINITY_DN26370_c0_g1_i1.p1 TRINITY_DN26370_c0_g1~~TRINITY_DN26370_c0_g1_i1.p1  ORF type:complete len:197 (+),score=30.31 TRINITY_DN26370_c0_g1_i1:377-967(+)
MPLPPVWDNLSRLNPVTSQASLAMLSAIEAMQAAAPGSLLGMNTAGHGLVYSAISNPPQTSILVPQVTLGTGQPANLSVSQAASIIVCQAPGMTVCQPTGIVSRDAQEQTHYAITGFAPGMLVGRPGADPLRHHRVCSRDAGGKARSRPTTPSQGLLQGWWWEGTKPVWRTASLSARVRVRGHRSDRLQPSGECHS